MNGTKLFEGNCTTRLFNVTCQVYLGNLQLAIFNLYNSTAAAFLAPRFDLTLAAVGLGSVQSIEGTLQVIVAHSPYPIPVNLAPAFLPALKTVGSLIVQESLNVADLEVPPPVPRLTSLPGQGNLTAFGFPSSSAVTALKVQGTAFPSMASFPGLLCAPDFLNVTNNKQLASLSGLNRLTRWAKNQAGPATSIQGNALSGTASVSALSTLAGCPSTTLTGSTSPASPIIQVAPCSSRITVSRHGLERESHSEDALRIALLPP